MYHVLQDSFSTKLRAGGLGGGTPWDGRDVWGAAGNQLPERVEKSFRKWNFGGETGLLDSFQNTGVDILLRAT